MPTEIATKSLFFSWKLMKFLNVWSTSLVSENWIKCMHSRIQCKQKSPIRVYFFFLETQEVFKRAINLFGPYWEKGEVEFL